MWFVQHIKLYKVWVKFVKTVSQNMFTIGFPQHVLNSEALQFYLKQDQDIVLIYTKNKP